MGCYSSLSIQAHRAAPWMIGGADAFTMSSVKHMDAKRSGVERASSLPDPAERRGFATFKARLSAKATRTLGLKGTPSDASSARRCAPHDLPGVQCREALSQLDACLRVEIAAAMVTDEDTARLEHRTFK